MEKKAERFIPKPLRIGSVVADPPLVLAPMAGVTDEIYRRIMAEHGAGLVTTEMVSVEGLRRNQPATWRLCSQRPPLHVPLAVQIFGCDPAAAAEAAKLLEARGTALIDINAGCPVRKIVRQGAGAALLRDGERLAALLDRVRKAVSIPVTVKIRVGWDEASSNAVEVARRLASAGADAITLHARTAVQLYTGKADWSWIRRVKEAVGIPIIGNGDIDSPSQADRMLRETGCDGVMIGRASLGNPWLISTIAARWGRRAPLSASNGWDEYDETVRGHMDAFRETKPWATGQQKKILIWYSKGCPESGRLRAKLLLAGAAEGMDDVFRQWLQEVRAKGIPMMHTKVPETVQADDGAGFSNSEGEGS